MSTCDYDAMTVVTGGGLEAVIEDKEGDVNAVPPSAFKRVIGKGHPEFSSMRQQVAPYLRID